jgi:alpha-galactosidase
MWDSPVNSNKGNGVLMNLEIAGALAEYSGPGGWNDPDLLIVGLSGRGAIPGPGLAPLEYRSHMSMWCMLAAPLMATCDLRNMDADTQETLTNREIIAIDQDSLGKQGVRVFRDQDLEIWKKPLTGSEFAVALFNRRLKPERITADWECLGFKGGYQIRDVWAKQDLGVFAKSFSGDVPSHGTMVLRLSPPEKGNIS